MALYFILILYGAMVMQSVIEEKNSRVLEVMVSSVKPFDLMMGKILGIASVAAVQILIWGVLIVGTSAIAMPALIPADVTNKIKILSETSVTYKQLPYIKTIYPRMTTLNNKGKPAIEFQILRLCK